MYVTAELAIPVMLAVVQYLATRCQEALAYVQYAVSQGRAGARVLAGSKPAARLA